LNPIQSRCKAMKKGSNKKKAASGSVRIIAGNWRGSRLPVADLPGLRPSGDRSRETLFNWMQPFLRNSVCADLFAGSGALGMEAASRGAKSVVLVEKARKAALVLQENADRLKATQVEVINADAMQWLQELPPASLDIAFIDPPFGMGLETQALELLHTRDGMNHGGHVYVELASSASVSSP
jgi:16S rRNA (guanine966-N2)-methyltransferase